MEIKEAIKLVGEHGDANKRCPFCPPPAPTEYKTYPGSENKSGILGKNMENPEDLTKNEPNARKQRGYSLNGYVQEQQKLDPRCKPKDTTYSHQAHHLISGQQALMGTAMEGWILAGKKVDKDTGYSINSTGNGFWAPSYPNDYPLGVWGKTKGRQEKAEAVMTVAKAQIHISHHGIKDKGDTSGVHQSYDSYIKEYLATMSKRIHAWSLLCPSCTSTSDTKKKPQTNYRVHDALDKLSTHLQGEITRPAKYWRIFISRWALNYHIRLSHTERVKNGDVIL